MATTSVKRLQINEANSSIVIITSIAAFIFVFSAVACKTLISQMTYQNRIISAKRVAVNQLKSDIAATSDVAAAYKAFTTTAQNVIGGNTAGVGPKDGNNAQIILDALPPSYDFPALATSLEALLKSQNVVIGNITGTDDEVAQSQVVSSGTPQPIAMPFQVSVTGNYADIQALTSALQRSIRPIQIQTFGLSGAADKLTLNLTAQTFFQPAKTLNISKSVIK